MYFILGEFGYFALFQELVNFIYIVEFLCTKLFAAPPYYSCHVYRTPETLVKTEHIFCLVFRFKTKIENVAWIRSECILPCFNSM